MNDLHWISAVFSPTGGTAAIAKAITGGQGHVVDLSVPVPVTPVADNTVLLAAAPVFGGRIPAVALERLAALSGSGPAVAVAVYGNRDYEDALLELSDALKAGGFQVIGAAAFVAQHSIAPTIAQGRPDQADLEAAANFGRAVLDKLAGPDPLAPVTVPGNTPYKDWKGVPFHPAAGESCIAPPAVRWAPFRRAAPRRPTRSGASPVCAVSPSAPVGPGPSPPLPSRPPPPC